MKRAIIYGRVSTNKQSAESIETQIQECEKWAKENDCIIIDVYDDSGQSGRAYNVGNRSGFQQIKQDAKNGRMDYALIHKVDRFARSAADYFIQERELQQYGVEVIVVGMPFLQDAGIVVKSIYIAMAEQFSTNLSSEVGEKMRTFARKAAFLGGKPPFGFNVVGEGKEKTLEINEAEAIGVRMIYDLYLRGYGYIQISKLIYKEGFTNSLGNPFTASHIAKMLSSKKYNGWYVFGIREKINGKDQKTKNKEKIIEVPNQFKKIIDDKTFEAVQAKRKNSVVHNKRRVRYYPFTGLATCGCCGRAVTGYCTVKKDRDKTYVYYRCTGRKVNGCTLPSINAEYLENYVIEKIKKYVFDGEFTTRLIKEVESNLSGDIVGFKKAQKSLEKELKEINNQIKEAMKDKYSKKINERAYNELMQEYEEMQMSLETRLANINQQINFVDKTQEIKEYVEHLKTALENATDEVKFAFLKQTVHSIVLTPQKAEVFVYMSAPPTRGRLYKDRLPNILHGEALFTLDIQQSNCPSNINRGVPRDMIDKQLKVFTDNGLSLVSFETSPILEFNINGK